MTIKEQFPAVPFGTEARVIALALTMACENETVRQAFPMANRALLFDLRDKWQMFSETPEVEGSE